MFTVTLHIEQTVGASASYEATFTELGETPSARMVYVGPSGDDPRTRDKRSRILSSEEAGRLLQLVSAITVMPVPPYAMGRNGTFYTLKVQRGFNSAAFTWWNDLPESWWQLEKVVQVLMGYDRQRDS